MLLLKIGPNNGNDIALIHMVTRAQRNVRRRTT
jgi:hypothetical protein